MIWRETTFFRRDLPVDYTAWYACTFKECVFRYFGDQEPLFSGCAFDHCDWHIDPSVDIKAFLKRLQTYSPEAAESLLDSIRRETVRIPKPGPAGTRLAS